MLFFLLCLCFVFLPFFRVIVCSLSDVTFPSAGVYFNSTSMRGTFSRTIDETVHCRKGHRPYSRLDQTMKSAVVWPSMFQTRWYCRDVRCRFNAVGRARLASLEHDIQFVMCSYPPVGNSLMHPFYDKSSKNQVGRC
jgi:hypothetical protein